MSAPESKLLLIGLAGSGKTNFVVGLDVSLDEQTDSDGLIHADLAEDRLYLQPLKEQWLRGEELKHTSRLQPPKPHTLLVKHLRTGKASGFILPDLAGETFDGYFETRSLPESFANQLREADGVLLFLHCDHNADHTVMEELSFIETVPEPVSSKADAIEADEESSGETAESKVPPWQLKDASRQTKLVELLQFSIELQKAGNSKKVAVMISAWDLIEKMAAGKPAMTALSRDPLKFLEKCWPLLFQFLESHPDCFEFRVYGVSARGGGASPQEIARLTAIARPSDRLLLVDGAYRSNDITRPIRWLLGITDTIAVNHG
jgi:hypothetical protein